MENQKSIFSKLREYINFLLTFPKGGFTRYQIDVFMKKASAENSKNIKLLDVGAGHKPYKKLFKDSFYESCEHETIYKEVNLKNSDKHSFYCDITKEIPKPDNHYDLIICNEVLEHINEPFLALKEFNRILKPNGKLVLTAPQSHGLHQEPHNYFNYLSHGLEYLLKKANFTDIQVSPLGGIFHLLGKVLGNAINTLVFSNNKYIQVLLYPVEVFIKIILYPIFILLFFLDYLDKDKKWTINYGSTCKKQ